MGDPKGMAAGGVILGAGGVVERRAARQGRNAGYSVICNDGTVAVRGEKIGGILFTEEVKA